MRRCGSLSSAVFAVFLYFTAFLVQVCGIQVFTKENCNSPLGLGNGKIQDSQLTASSHSNLKTDHNTQHDMKPKYGRLNNHLAWCTEEPHSSWLVVNLGHVALVTGIATQGYRTLFNHYYVKKYQIQHSMDGSNWSYIETNGSIKTFNGNSNGRGTVNNTFTAVQARYIKVLPISHKYRTCMRIELFGCVNDTLIVNNAAIQTSTTKHPRLQSTTMKSSTIKITSLNNSEEPTVKSTESTHHSTTLRIVTHAKPEHEAVIGNLKSPKLNMLILGISISAGITALVICILIVLMILKKRRRRMNQFEHCDVTPASECLCLDDQMPCLKNYDNNSMTSA